MNPGTGKSNASSWLNVAVRYSIAVAAFLAGFLIREGFPSPLPDGGCIIFVPAVLLVTYLVGIGPAIMTAVLSAAVVWFYFLPPFNPFRLERSGVVYLGAFALCSIICIFLVNWARFRIKQVDTARATLGKDLVDMGRLHRLSDRLVREGNDCNKCLNEALEAAIAISRAAKGILQLFEPDVGTLTTAAQYGFEEPFLKCFEHVRNYPSACGAAMRSAERMIVEDVTISEIFAGHPSQRILIDAGVRAMISTPLKSSKGAVLGIISTHFGAPHRPSERELNLLSSLMQQTADYLERKRSEETEKTLVLESQHRSNNLLSVVHAIAQRSLTDNQSVAHAKEVFEGRLQALARANRKLTKSNWSGVTLAEIVREELEAFSDRTTVDGDIVALRPQYAQYFTLVLHELATNAAKYGALSDEAGKISVSWAIQRNDSNRVLKFKWQEKDGPCVVPPAKHGFGSLLIRSSFPDARVNYAAEGLSCEIDLPVADNGHESSAARTASRNLFGSACKTRSPALYY